MYLQKGSSQDSTVVDRATEVRPSKPNLKKKTSTFYSSQIHTHSQGGLKSCLLALVYSTAIEHVWHYATSVLFQRGTPETLFRSVHIKVNHPTSPTAGAVNTERPWAERERERVGGREGGREGRLG